MPRVMTGADWYWLVGDGPAGQVYHSRRDVFVPLADADYQAFLLGGDQATGIASQAELRDELEKWEVPYLGQPLRPIEEARPRVNRARARLVRVGFTLASGAGAAIQWAAGGFDPLGMNGPGNPDRITIPAGRGGLYLVTVSATFATNGTGDRALQIRRNANPVRGGEFGGRAAGARATSFFGTKPVQLDAGDILRVAWSQDSGGDLVCDATVELGRVE